MNYEELKEQLIFETYFGSKLYGTDTPKSDTDIKGIYIPTKRQLYLNDFPKSIHFDTKKDENIKNGKDDIDREYYSIQYFWKLAYEGQTEAIDLIHASSSQQTILKTSDLWKIVYKNRKILYTRNMSSFLSYCKKQAAKYSIKSSKLNDANMVLNKFFRGYGNVWKDFSGNRCSLNDIRNFRVSVCWNELPETENFKKSLPDSNGIRFYEFGGKKIQETSKMVDLELMLERFINVFGERARQAANNENIDWKAMSHAIRAGLQLIEIYETNDLEYPLSHAELLTEIKQGERSFKIVSAYLEEIIQKVEKLSKESAYPDKVNKELWYNLLYEICEDYYKEGK